MTLLPSQFKHVEQSAFAVNVLDRKVASAFQAMIEMRIVKMQGNCRQLDVILSQKLDQPLESGPAIAAETGRKSLSFQVV